MSTATNAFWREVMDYLPGLNLLFRIDEHEMTHLIFVTEAIRNELGFSPEEYVLASEDEKTIVSNDLDKLIDRIAERSHGNDISSDSVCRLTDRTGQQLEYTYDFRVFQTKSAKQNLISVTLFPKGSVSATADSSTGGKVTIDDAFVAESQLTKDVLERIDSLSQQPMHVLIRGEKSVGKRTLAEKLAQKTAVLSGNQQVWVLDLPAVGKSMKAKQRLFAGVDPDNPEESLLDDIDKDLQLVIIELGLMKLDDQKDLLKLMANRAAKGRKTRIIATSSESVEDLMVRGKIDAALVYKMSFVSVFVPPLRERTQDIIACAQVYSAKIAEALMLETPIVDDRFVKRLIASGLSGNFEELFASLRTSLIASAKYVGEASSYSGSRGTVQHDKKPSEIFFTVSSPQAYDSVTAAYLKAVLEYTSGKVYGSDGAAAMLDMKPTTLQSKLKKLNVR